MRRSLSIVVLVLWLAPPLAGCELHIGKYERNPTVYSTNHRFAAILRVHEKIPDFGRRRLVLGDPVPNWDGVPLAIYDRHRRVSEFPVDISTVNDLIVSDSGRYVVGIMWTRNYPCPGPPYYAHDRIATIFKTDGTLIKEIELQDVAPNWESSREEPFGALLDYSIHIAADGSETLFITRGKVTCRVSLATGLIE